MQPLPSEADQRPRYDPTDHSIRFHIAHSAQREVEILHDQLLHLLDGDTNARHADGQLTVPIQPRDIIVMVPEVDKFAPAIRAVFGQYARGDKRHIPFEIADVSARRTNPMLVALDWLLRLPQQRCLQSEVRDLLDVPAVATRFGIAQHDLPRLAEWIEAAGVRWGLDAAHREALELAPAGAQNAWLFGMRRMLLGYANGPLDDYEDIEPLARVGGLDAALAGSLAQFIGALMHWRGELALARTPAEWGQLAERLQHAFFKATEEDERLTLAQLHTALQRWLEDCAGAAFDDAVPVAILREAWLGPLDEKSLHQRFISGGVTFCTLLPMRALPYRVVCLLGMNDGDFPRRAQRTDFDLLALPGMAHPGDRSRREDDRYLMLEALLSARDHLYISWVGKSVRDNSAQPPSVLVAQLRDYLKAGWQDLDLQQLTVEHQLQPFSRRYFEEKGLSTFAMEWRAAHEEQAQAPAPTLAPYVGEADAALTIAELGYFLKQPVKQFFRRRLKVQFDARTLAGIDDEPFALNKLERYQVSKELLTDDGPAEPIGQIEARLCNKIARMKREGRLPIGQLATKLQAELVEELAPVRLTWLNLNQRLPRSQDKLRVTLRYADRELDDWIDQIRKDGSDAVWASLTPSGLLKTKKSKLEKKNLRADKLIEAYVRQLIASAQGHTLTGYLVARDGVARFTPIAPADAQAQLTTLMSWWQRGMDAPLPTACKTALSLLEKGAAEAEKAYDGAAFQADGHTAEREETCLARLWDDYDMLSSAPGYAEVSEALYRPLLKWVDSSVQLLPLDAMPEQMSNV
jgi:exodeoxyribonuclease V gamma subunit